MLNTRTALLFAALFAFTLPTLGQTVQGYEVIAGNYSPKIVKNHGQYLRVRPVGTTDTLWLWIQHSIERTAPRKASADAADIVLWCNPDRYPHPNHAMPEAGDIWVRSVILKDDHRRTGFRQQYLVVVDLSRMESPNDEDLRALLITAARSR